MVSKNIQWHYISEEGMPKIKDNKPKAFLICYRVELGEKIIFGSFTDIIPIGKFIESCTIALIQKRESKDGFAYTPANKFYWGGDIYESAYAWARLPEPIEYKD